ncbi:MAG: hypothetical protein ABJA20_09850 [Novosphingobium sp.]
MPPDNFSKSYPRIISRSNRDRQGWDNALHHADDLVSASATVRDAVVLFDTRKQLDTPALVRLMGLHHARTLRAGGPIALRPYLPMRCETIRSLGHLPQPTLIIACWADMKMLDFVDGLANVAGVVVIPLYEDSADDWETRWSPYIAGREATAEPAPLITDRTVEQALLALTKEVNLAEGLAIRYAREEAETTLRILRVFGHSQDPARIKNWAIRHGWRPRDAVALADMAKRILEQKTKPKQGAGSNPQRRYARWVAAAQSRFQDM